jgi:hypothetical protein
VDLGFFELESNKIRYLIVAQLQVMKIQEDVHDRRKKKRRSTENRKFAGLREHVILSFSAKVSTFLRKLPMKDRLFRMGSGCHGKLEE